ncbi:MAG: STAS/SEC14 domain-containing protein [Candidatus Thiodiazotropha sp.]
MKRVSEFEGALIPGLEIRAFSREQREQAVAWLESRQSD